MWQGSTVINRRIRHTFLRWQLHVPSTNLTRDVNEKEESMQHTSRLIHVTVEEGEIRYIRKSAGVIFECYLQNADRKGYSWKSTLCFFHMWYNNAPWNMHPVYPFTGRCKNALMWTSMYVCKMQVLATLKLHKRLLGACEVAPIKESLVGHVERLYIIPIFSYIVLYR